MAKHKTKLEKTLLLFPQPKNNNSRTIVYTALWRFFRGLGTASFTMGARGSSLVGKAEVHTKLMPYTSYGKQDILEMRLRHLHDLGGR